MLGMVFILAERLARRRNDQLTFRSARRRGASVSSIAQVRSIASPGKIIPSQSILPMQSRFFSILLQGVSRFDKVQYSYFFTNYLARIMFNQVT